MVWKIGYKGRGEEGRKEGGGVDLSAWEGYEKDGLENRAHMKGGEGQE